MSTPTDKPAKAYTPKWPDEIRDAVRYARFELAGKKPGANGGRPPAPSASDHIRVREVIGTKIDGDVTPDAVLKLTGLSYPKLTAVARFEVGTDDDLAKLREFGEAFREDKNRAWRRGRPLAQIVAAYVHELRAAQKK